MTTSRDLNGLNLDTKKLCKEFITKCKNNGIDILITSTFRDAESQNALYAQGRTKPGKKVTNAKAGESFHNYRCAFDFVPLVNGKAQWNDLSLFKKCGDIAESIGLEWAGNWLTFKEYAHCQFTNGKSLNDLKKNFKG